MSDISYNFAGKHVLVVGGSRGIGKATMLQFLKSGANVYCASRVSPKQQGVHWVQCDIRNERDIHSLFSYIDRKTNKLDFVINVAGTNLCAPIEDINSKEWDRVLDTNLRSFFLICKEAVSRMKKHGYGRIVNVSSSAHYGIDFEFDNMNGEKKYAGFDTYKKSKLANVMFTYELAKRIEGTGITANCLHPGFVSTNFGKNNNIFWRNAIRLAMMLTAISVKDGAKTSIHLACSDEVKDITGKFFANCEVKKGSSKAKNEEHNQKLWELSEEFVKPFL